MGEGIWFRWAVGGVMTFVATILVFVLANINDHNLKQDNQISSIQAENKQSAIHMERAFRELSEQNASTAKVLEGVVKTLEAIDTRGSEALRDHEKEDHGDDR